MECNICVEYNENKILSCNHNICVICYDKIKTFESILCPFCRYENLIEYDYNKDNLKISIHQMSNDFMLNLDIFSVLFQNISDNLIIWYKDENFDYKKYIEINKNKNSCCLKKNNYYEKVFNKLITNKIFLINVCDKLKQIINNILQKKIKFGSYINN